MAESEAKRRKVDTPTAKCANEADVGITEFVSPDLSGFEGQIKQRYSDFQVNEIDTAGNVVLLANVEMPSKPAETEPAKETEQTNIQEGEKSRALAELIGQQAVEQCFSLLRGALDGNKVKTEETTDKELRTKIHGLVREAFESVLDSRTEDGCIVIVKPTKRGKNRRRERTPRNAEYLQFTLYKENKDTMEALSMISRFLHVPTKSMTFAGTKDRRAVTSQRISWRRGSVERLVGLNGAFSKGNIRLGDFKFENAPLKLGDLSGNQFGIVVRNCKQEQLDSIEKSLNSLRDNGFINYFGLQRFGTFSVSSHTIGQYILCGDYQSAVDGILYPQDVTLEDSREAREVWKNEHDANKALELMPRRCVAECAMLGALTESDNALNALLRIPHALKTMYVHAYQSYIWNRAVSERIKLNAHEPIEGDLILSEENETRILRAVPVTKEQIESGAVTIFDVVMTTPGSDVLYPPNLETFYEKIMAEDGIDCHQMRHKIKEFAVFGSYRAIMAKPLFLEWSTRRYANDDDTILYTDREVLETNTRLAPEPDVKDSSNEDFKTAVVLKMGLSTSQYATMALREATKQDTSRNGEIYFGMQ